MSFRRWSVTICACTAVFVLLAVFKVFEIRAAIAFAESFPEPSENVETTIARYSELQPKLSIIGEIVAPKRLDVHNELAGEITAIGFESGDQVKQGQLLIQLDIAVEKAQLNAALSRVDLAQSMYDRASSLYQTKATSKETLDQAKADLAAAKAEVNILNRVIEKKTIRAAFDGQTGIHSFETGQFLAENSFITTLIGDLGFVWLDFKVPQFYRALPIGTELTVRMIGNENNKFETKAEVIAVNTTVSADNRSLFYRAKLKDEGKLRAHTMVHVDVPKGSSLKLIQVPAVAIQHDRNGTFVFALSKDEKGFRARKQKVALENIVGEKAYISDGLNEGDHIATIGAFKLREGILVFDATAGENS